MIVVFAVSVMIWEDEQLERTNSYYMYEYEWLPMMAPVPPMLAE